MMEVIVTWRIFFLYIQRYIMCSFSFIARLFA